MVRAPAVDDRRLGAGVLVDLDGLAFEVDVLEVRPAATTTVSPSDAASMPPWIVACDPGTLMMGAGQRRHHQDARPATSARAATSVMRLYATNQPATSAIDVHGPRCCRG